MRNSSKAKLPALILILAVVLGISYKNLDTAAKACFLMVDRILNRAEVKSAVKANPTPETGSVGPPAGITEAKALSTGRDRRKIVVSRNGKSNEYWIRGTICQAYDEIGGVKSILGVPTSNEYRWKGGLRQNFERGHWLFWSKSTGIMVDYTPAGYGIDSTSTLQPPILTNGKPSVEWCRFSKNNYFITQDFGEKGHLGQDLALSGNPDPGYEVYPVTDGKVVFSGWTGRNSYGYSVLIQHPLGGGRYFYSQYSHLHSQPEVNPGQIVTKATVLGLIGNTGKSTGPHLDFQIKEMPRLDAKKDQNITPPDLGYGYTPGHNDFNGNIYYDIRTGQTYYKPSYLIENYKNDPAALINEFHRIMDVSLTLRTLPPMTR